MATSSKSPSNRRDSVTSSGGSPFRQRRSSLSIAQPPSPSLPLSATASINASMRGGSPGPPTTAKDSRASRRTSVVADLALADDKLPPPAEIASVDRKGPLADNNTTSNSFRVPSLSAQSSSNSPFSTSNPFSSGNAGTSSGRSRGNSISSSPIDQLKSGALRDPMTGVVGEGGGAHHHRTPSVGQVHQQMEQEQEAQVNRLLITIHQQQTQIEKLQRQLESSSAIGSDGGTPAPPTIQMHDYLPSAERVSSAASSTLGSAITQNIEFPPAPTPQRAHSTSSAGTTVASTMPAAKPSPTMSPANLASKMTSMHTPLSQHSNRPGSSRSSSRAASPALRASASGSLLENDELKYWQAEAGNLTKENDLLKQRIRELEFAVKGDKASGSEMAVDT